MLQQRRQALLHQGPPPVALPRHDCNHTFSVMSGTIFASHKLLLKVYLAAIIAQGVKISSASGGLFYIGGDT